MRKHWWKIGLAVVIVLAAILLMWLQKPTQLTPAQSERISDSGHAVITITDQGFVPQAISVRNNQPIVFKNTSSVDVWPLSDVLVGKGQILNPNCTGSKFDPCGALKPGDKWQLNITNKGNWVFSDHLQAKHKATIIIE